MKILSYSDVITNSSSEVFVLHPKPEVNREEFLSEIKNLLDSLCELTGLYPEDVYTINISNTSYIDEDWYYRVEKGDILIDSVSDNTIPGWLMDFIEDIHCLPKFEDKFSGFFAEDLGTKEIKKERWNKEKRQYETVVVPSEIRSIQRHHLG